MSYFIPRDEMARFGGVPYDSGDDSDDEDTYACMETHTCGEPTPEQLKKRCIPIMKDLLLIVIKNCTHEQERQMFTRSLPVSLHYNQRV